MDVRRNASRGSAPGARSGLRSRPSLPRLRVFFALLALAPLVPAAVASPPPVEAFSSDGDFIAPAISPDGSSLVYVTYTAEGRRMVAVKPLAPGAQPRAVLLGEAGKDGSFLVRRCWFKSDRRLLCHFDGIDFVGGQPFPVSRIVALDADGTNIKVLVQRGKAGGSQFQDRIVSTLPDDPTGVLIELDDDEDIFPSVFRLDVETGKLQPVARQRKPVLHWVADRSGVVRFGYGFEGRKGIYVTRDGADAPWRDLARFDRFDPDRLRVLGFGPLPNMMLVASEHRGRDAIWAMDLGDQKDLELLFSHPEVDVDGAYEWPGGDRIIGFEYETDRPQLRMIDSAAASLQTTIDKLMPDTINRLVDGSRNGRRLIVSAWSDVKPTTYYLLDLDKASITPLGLTNIALAQATLAPMRPVKVPGRGGVQMPGYLTLPVVAGGGAAARKLPAIVLPHGGPYTRDSWGYDPIVQLLASRGYAVLQVNYRGSTGYGSEWLEAGFQGWGTVMHDDISAAARWLATEGIADPRRICIVGWSYGGYAALIGAVKEPTLYRCAVSVAGVSDLGEMIAQERRFYGGRESARQSIGDVDFASLSPRRRAAEIKVPVLLAHGKADWVVPVWHSEKMAEALKRAGRPTELLVLKGGDHSLRTPALRRELYERLVAFLAANLAAPADAGAAASPR